MGEYKDGWDRHVINRLNSKSYGVKLGYDFGNDNDLIFNYQNMMGSIHARTMVRTIRQRI